MHVQHECPVLQGKGFAMHVLHERPVLQRPVLQGLDGDCYLIVGIVDGRIDQTKIDIDQRLVFRRRKGYILSLCDVTNLEHIQKQT